MANLTDFSVITEDAYKNALFNGTADANTVYLIRGNIQPKMYLHSITLASSEAEIYTSILLPISRQLTKADFENKQLESLLTSNIWKLSNKYYFYVLRSLTVRHEQNRTIVSCCISFTL